jgi:hypothetical protein
MPSGGLGWIVKSTPMLLQHHEIESWSRNNGATLEGWQLAAIQLIDESHVKMLNSPPAPPTSAKNSKDKSGWLSMFTAMGLRKGD